MKQKITCFCENAFEVDISDEINLDDGKSLAEILDGSFLTFKCPSCGKKHKPEFPIYLVWPSKKVKFEVFRELDRGEFYRRKKLPSDRFFTDNNFCSLETIISFPELAERLAILNDGFDPAAIEAIKYYLHVKAEEQYPDNELTIYYYSSDSAKESLEFHIHGIREGEVAVMKISSALYKQTLDDYKRNPKSELFSSLRVNSYLSVKNTMRPEQFR